MALVAEDQRLTDAKKIYDLRIKKYFLPGQEFNTIVFNNENELDAYM